MTDSAASRARVREATGEDCASLSLVASATFLETFAGMIDGDALLAHCATAHDPAKLAAALAGGARAWLAEIGGAPVGYASLCEPELEAALDRDIELKKIYVLSRFHGSGIAGDLFEAAWAAASDRRRLLLGVKDDNYRAIAFYRKMGFEQIATRQFDIGGMLYDDVVFARPIDRK